MKYPFIPYKGIDLETDDILTRSLNFRKLMKQRRSVRDFSDQPVPIEVIENIILTAGGAPSGANKQPWTFCVVSDLTLKSEIRQAAEAEEFLSYNGRMSEEWLRDLAPLGTDWNKPFLENAPWLIILFKKAYEVEDNEKRKNYYVNESVGIAAGFLISAIHNAGLVTLTHTPSPMNFLQKILKRPENERAFLLLPVGFPSMDAKVPDIGKKTLQEISVWFE